jgi:hypothetical protein
MSGLVERRPAAGRATRWAPDTTITIHEEYAMTATALPLIPLDFLGYADPAVPLHHEVAPSVLQAADDEIELDEEDDLEEDEDDDEDEEDDLEDDDEVDLLDEDDEDDEDEEDEDEEEELEA